MITACSENDGNVYAGQHHCRWIGQIQNDSIRPADLWRNAAQRGHWGARGADLSEGMPLNVVTEEYVKLLSLYRYLLWWWWLNV